MILRKLSSFVAGFLATICFLNMTPAIAQSISDSDTVLGAGQVDNKYLPADLSHISKIYWALGKFNLENEEAIDNFLLINECELYNRYFYNEFEWVKIRHIQQQYLYENVENFTTNIEVLQPIEIGEYDIYREVFEVKKGFPHTKQVFVDTLSQERICGQRGEIAGYPKNLVVILNRPFSLSEFPVKAEIADIYIREAKKRYDNLPARLKRVLYERTGYVRLLIRLTLYETTIGGDGFREEDFAREFDSKSKALVHGVLEGIEIYADEDLQLLMYKGKPKYTNIRRRRGQSDDAGDQ